MNRIFLNLHFKHIFWLKIQKVKNNQLFLVLFETLIKTTYLLTSWSIGCLNHFYSFSNLKTSDFHSRLEVYSFKNTVLITQHYRVSIYLVEVDDFTVTPGLDLQNLFFVTRNFNEFLRITFGYHLIVVRSNFEIFAVHGVNKSSI